MSVLSTERASEDTRDGVRQLARPVVLARAAGPAAKAAGVAARDGARNAATWAAPRVNGARAWTAPRIEWGGLAIRDTVGPRICEVLTTTARRVEVTAPRAETALPRRRWPAVVAGMVVLAAAGAAAAVLLRRRKDDATGGAAGPGVSPQTAHDGQPPAGTDGRASAEDMSR
jgi:hypothetical protein